MLTSALPTSAVNAVNSGCNGASPAASNGSADAAPDGFARLLDQASKPDAVHSPDKPDRPAEGSETGNSGNGGSRGIAGGPAVATAASGEAESGAVDVRPTTWPQRLQLVKGQHPGGTRSPGHVPVRLPPEPVDDGAALDTLDALALAAETLATRTTPPTEGGSEAGAQDAAAAILAAAATAPAAPAPSAPTPDSVSALLAAWNASAAAAAQAGAAGGSTEAASTTQDSGGAEASGRAVIAALANNATRLGSRPADGQSAGPVAGPAEGWSAGRVVASEAEPAAGLSLAGIAPPVEPTGAAGPPARADLLAAGASALSQAGLQRGVPAQAPADSPDSDPSALGATQNGSALTEAVALTVDSATHQAAARTAREAASPAAADAAARASDPSGEGIAGRRDALEAGARISVASGAGANAPPVAARRNAGADTGPEARTVRVAAGDGVPARSDGGTAVHAPTPANTENRSDDHKPAQADLHGGVAVATASAAAAAAAVATSAAAAVAHESGNGPQRRSETEGGGVAGAAAATNAGGVPMGGALAWMPAAAGGSATPATVADGRIAASPGSADFAPQLAAHISTFVQGGLQHARLELNPAEMGPLTVQIQLDGNAARVHLAAEHAGTRAALEQAMPQLAGSLRENGLTLSGGGVFEQPRQQQQAQAGDGRSPGNPNGGGNNDNGRDSRRSGPPDAPVNGLAGTTAAGRRRAGVVDLVA